MSSTKRCNLIDVAVLINVYLLGELSADLTTRDILTARQLQLTKQVKSSWVVVLKNLFLPLTDRNVRFDNVGEVLIEVGILNLLNNFRRFTDVINKSTRRSSDRINVQNTFSNVSVVDDTRRSRNHTLNLTTNNKITISVYNFQNLRTDLPTIILGNFTECISEFIRFTLEYFFTFQESRSFHNCFCLTTKNFCQKNLTTITLSQESDKVARFGIHRSQSESQLIGLQTRCLACNCIISLSAGKRGQTNATGLGELTNSSANGISTELNLSTSCDTMGEIKLKIVEIEVNNISKLGLQSNYRL